MSSEKGKLKSDTALEKAQAKNARLRQLKNNSNKQAQEAEKESSRIQRIYENNTALMGHLQEQPDLQKAEIATLALEVEDKAEEVQGLEHRFRFRVRAASAPPQKEYRLARIPLLQCRRPRRGPRDAT